MLGTGTGGAFGWAHHRHVGTLDGIECWYLTSGPVTTVLLVEAHGENYIWAQPYISPIGGTIDRVACYCSGVSGGGNRRGRLGIYTSVSATDLTPSALVLDAGEFSTASTGWKVLSGFTFTFDPRLFYYFAFTLDHTGADPTFWKHQQEVQYPTFDHDNVTDIGRSGAFNGAGYGLSNPFTAPTTNAAANFMGIFVRYSA